MSVTRKVALVIDALPGMGGAEKVLMTALELFPGAPVYTLLYNRMTFAGSSLDAHPVVPSWIDRLPGVLGYYRILLPLMPATIERFDLSRYDLILSFSYAVAHGVGVRPGQQHFSYIFTPMRYAWGINGLSGPVHEDNPLVKRLFRWFRSWDVAAAAQVDRYAAVSGWIGRWVQTAYGRGARVIYPPVEVERFSAGRERGKYYLTVSRLVAHKRIDLIVQAFNRMKLPLLVVGEGPERQRLERQSGPTIKFLGYQGDRTVAGLLEGARGFISSAKEDFGIAIVEAQAAGCPVIAYRAGGALETVVEGESGVFFDRLEAESLAEAVECFEDRWECFDSRRIAAGVRRFNKQRFLEELDGFARAS